MLLSFVAFVILFFDRFYMPKTMDNFVRNLGDSVQQVVQHVKVPSEDVIIVTGHESCDLDSAVSALVSSETKIGIAIF